jgi:cytochrome c oxidase subunit IV
VLIGLAVLTAVEYGIAVALHSNVLPYLAVIALIKAGLIVQYFMHVAQLWREEGGHA